MALCMTVSVCTPPNFWGGFIGCNDTFSWLNDKKGALVIKEKISKY